MENKQIKFYRINDPKYPLHFIKTDCKTFEVTILAHHSGPYSIKCEKDRYYIESKGKLYNCSIITLCPLDSTGKYVKITEMEFEEQMQKLNNLIYPERQKSESMSCVTV